MGRWDGVVCERVGREVRSREGRLWFSGASRHLHTQTHAHALADQYFVKKKKTILKRRVVLWQLI